MDIIDFLLTTISWVQKFQEAEIKKENICDSKTEVTISCFKGLDIAARDHGEFWILLQ